MWRRYGHGQRRGQAAAGDDHAQPRTARSGVVGDIRDEVAGHHADLCGCPAPRALGAASIAGMSILEPITMRRGRVAIEVEKLL